MKEKILTALKTKYKTLGFSEKAFDGVAEFLSKTVTEEAQIEIAIGGVEVLLKSFQGDVDSRVNKFKEENDKLKKQLEDAGKTEPDDKSKKTPPDPAKETPEQKEIRELKERFDKMTAEKTHNDLSAKIKAGLKEKGIPDAIVKIAMEGRKFEKDEEIEPFITQVETANKEYAQSVADTGLGSSYRPVASQSTPAAKVEDDIKNWAGKDKVEKK